MTNMKSRPHSKREGLSRRSVLELGALGAAAALLPRSAFAADKKLKVAAIFATPIEEPWDNQVHVALLKAEKELGIEYKWSEKVQTADFGRVMREYAQGGYELVLGDAQAAFRPLSPVAFTLDRVESNPRFVSISRPANAAIRVELKFDMEGRGGSLHILLPYATIEPIRELLLESFMGEKLGRDPIWENHLATEVWQAGVDVTCVLHETRMPLKRVMKLEIGDTLMFDARPDSTVSLRCGDFIVTEGRIGRVDGKIAVQVVSPLRRSKTTLAAFDSLASHLGATN